MTTQTRQRIVSITVGATGGVSALATEHEPDLSDIVKVDITSYDSLAGFLASHDVPAGTPIYRFDRTDYEAAWRFAVHGPMQCQLLAAGTIRRVGTPALPYVDGDPIDGFDYVAPDVYNRLARAAGIVVEAV